MENAETNTLSQDEINPLLTNVHTCPHCTKAFSTDRGLRIHIGRKHHDAQTQVHTSEETDDSTYETFIKKIANLKRSTRILKRVPRGARFQVAEKLSSSITDSVTENTESSWFKLLLFSYQCLNVPEKQENKSLTAAVKENTSLEGNLIPECKKNEGTRVTPFQKRVLSKFEDFDIRGAVRIASSDDTLAEVNDENYTKLLNMHPAPSRPLDMLDPVTDETPYFQTNENEVLKAISSFRNGSASGIDGLSPQHLKDLTSKSAGDSGRKLLVAVTKLVNMMLKGQVNKSILKCLFGANLCALNKKDGGLRPIAVGSVFRRLTAKICCFVVQEESAKYFQPLQLGFGTKQGCETIVHSCRTFLNQRNTTSDVLVKIDYSNAFNSAERDVILQQVKTHFPFLYPFLYQCYATPSLLFFGDRTLLSQVGAQQGDPAGPLLFSLAIHPIVVSLQSDFKLFYLDDGTIAGNPETVLQDVMYLVKESKKIGLNVNPSKCELFFTSSQTDGNVETRFQEELPGIRTMSSSDLMLLGSPLFLDGVKNDLEKKFESMHLMFNRLKDLPNHVSYFLLKHCLGIPKIMYTLRTTPTFMVENILKDMDLRIKKCLEEIINIPLDQNQFAQASLPVSMGGIGIRSMTELSLPTFLASCAGIKPIASIILNIPVGDLVFQYCTEATETWLSKYEDIPDNPSHQKHWDEIAMKLKFSTLKMESAIDVARMKALQKKEAGAWLNVVPIRNIGTFLDNNTLRVCIGIRLGCDICRPHKCVCGVVIDARGLHGLSCHKSAGRYFRHGEVNQILKRSLASVDIPAVLEPSGLMRDDGKRPDGMTIVPWSHGNALVWDYTCVDTFANSYIQQTSAIGGAAAEMAARKKHGKYSSIKASGCHFIGFATETSGVWAHEGKKWMEELGNALVEKTGDSRAGAFLTQRIALAIQRGNAASILGSLPYGKGLDAVFYL